MSVRVEVLAPTGRFWITFPNHEAVWLFEDEVWSDYECDCHPIWPGTIDTEGLI